MTDEPPDDGAGRTTAVLRVVALGLWSALVLASARCLVFFVMERVAHGSDQARTELRMAAAAGEIARSSLIVGLAVAVLASLARGGKVVRRVAGTVTMVLVAVLIQVHLAGTLDDETRRIGWFTDRGRMANMVLFGVAVLYSIGAHRAAKSAHELRLRSALVPAFLLLIAPPVARHLWGSLADEMNLREVVRELPFGDIDLEVLSARDDLAPHSAVITPSLDYEVDGADMPALVLPPPATVRIALPDFEGTLWLTARTGIDHSVFREASAGEFEGTRVRFRLAVNGDAAAEEELDVASLGVDQGVQQGSPWVDATGEDGIPLRGGDVLELSTVLLDAQGERVSAEPLACGFGGLTLERRTRVRRTRPSPERPNIVLVVMDTQRADRLSTYGYDRETSPRLTELAARGILYEETYSTASWTWPSTASILTGLHPQVHGVGSERSCYLAPSLVTLPEALQRVGYTTAAFSANPLIVPTKNFDQGFESFEHGRGAFRQTDLLLPAILEWIEAVRETRFFLYVQLTDPHVPLVPLPEGRERFAADVEDEFSPYMIARAGRALRATHGRNEDGTLNPDAIVGPDVQRKIHQQYDACTWTGDHYVGRIIDQLAALGLAEETVVAYTSDHGEEIFEHGLAEHGKQLYSELVRVPLVLAGPGVPRGVRVPHPVSNRHIAPTLARIAGADLPGLEDALDLVRPEAHGDAADDGVLFSTEQGWWNGRTSQTILGLRRGDWVLHFAPSGAGWGEEVARPDGDWRLFDLAGDPGERIDRAAENPDLARELREELVRRVGELAAQRVRPGVAAGEATLELLHDIGYLGD